MTNSTSVTTSTHYMSAPSSIQFNDEGLPMAEHPGIVFKDGPTGRHAALALGPDVWEVVTYIKESQERGDLAIEATAEALCLPSTRVRAALDYYATYRDEIEAEMAEAIEASRIAEAARESRLRLLA